MVTHVLHCPSCQGPDIVWHGKTPPGKHRCRCRQCTRARVPLSAGLCLARPSLALICSVLVSDHHSLSLCLERRTLSFSAGLSVAPSLRSGPCTCKNPCRSCSFLFCPLIQTSH